MTYIDNFTESFDPSSIWKSDILGASFNNPSEPSSVPSTPENYGFWVNGTQLAAFSIGLDGLGESPPLATMPRTPYPFPRITGFSPDKSSKIFVYHQMNASAFAEDQWDASVGGWLSASFGVVTG